MGMIIKWNNPLHLIHLLSFRPLVQALSIPSIEEEKNGEKYSTVISGFPSDSQCVNTKHTRPVTAAGRRRLTE